MCDSCKIVVNELLTFLQNKCDVLDEISLIQIAASWFNEEEIEKAKSIAYEDTTIKKINRKGDKKKDKDITDMVKVLKETDPDDMPIFVAKDLSRVPPVTFDHLDVTCVLKNLSTIRSQILILQQETNRLNNEFKSLKVLNKNMQQSALTITRHESQTREEVINPMQCQRPDSASKADANAYTQEASPSTVKAIPSYAALVKEGQGATTKGGANKDFTYSDMPCLHSGLRFSNKLPSKNNYTSNTNENIKEVDDDGFTKVQRKRKRILNMHGTSKNNNIKLKVADMTFNIYVSRFQSSTTEDDIKEYLTEKGIEAMGVEVLQSKMPTNFRSFKLVFKKNDYKETWLHSDELSLLDNINPNFYTLGTSAMNLANSHHGRPYGGVAILWHKNINATPVKCDSPRLTAIHIKGVDTSILLITVYMPTECNDNLEEFSDCLSKIITIADEKECHDCIIMGDFNADPQRFFGKELLQFANEKTCLVV
ncbi:unnamed protein product [Danaus chrysippus]|uniref:(African queen) hypothetical protein n=1 Tax=Danaus chrysippus TaxID=151541 RepID=A0A8J2QLN0_9NEOP|nr:unnamed protein product [Danaus chrysippus]